MPASPLDPNYSGATARYAQNYELLQGLCEEIHVIRINTGDAINKVLEFEKNSARARSAIQSSTSWNEVSVIGRKHSKNRINAFWLGLSDPVSFEFEEADVIATKLRKTIQEIEPDLIWVEGTELAAAVSLLSPTVPWILSHHDLMYRIREIRYGARKTKERFLLTVCRRAEQKVIKSANWVLTGSTSDGERLRDLGASDVRVIPVAYEDEKALQTTRGGWRDVRIVHLGSLETTANRVGLEAYLKRAHSRVASLCAHAGIHPQLWIIGDSSKVKAPLAGLLKKDDTVLCNFVPDLSTVLRPFDISILPYEHDTGYRTKLPLLFKHRQTIVATRAAVMGSMSPGLEEACVIVDKLEDFSSVIARLAADRDERERIGRAGRDFFEKHYTLEAAQGQYEQLLQSTVASS